MNSPASINDIDGSHYDLAVIGGGAQGCAMSWEAASRGLRVVLIEKADFGAATSANSLRIVHGGLRYLQSLDFKRSRKSAAERSALLRIAPHLVRPLKCAIPTLPKISRGRLAVAAGLALNALLTVDRNRDLDRERRIGVGGLGTVGKLASAAPGINTSGLTGFGYWYDAVMVDPERLSLAFALSARDRGADILNHVRADTIDGGNQQGNVAVNVTDMLTGQSARLVATAIADCRGLCFPELSEQRGGDAGGDRRFLIAANVVLNRPAPAFAVGFPARSQDGRALGGGLFFANETDGAMTVGTWYFDAPDGATEPQLNEMQRHQILAEINLSTQWNIAPDDIREFQLGLLPSAARNGGAQSAPADRPVIAHSPTDQSEYIWRVQTEKWTTVRGVAERAVDEIAEACQFRISRSNTKALPLHGATYDSLQSLASDLRSKTGNRSSPEIDRRLMYKYGSNALEIAEILRLHPELARPLPGTPTITEAEVDYVLHAETPRTLSDLLFRRLKVPRYKPLDSQTVAVAARLMGKMLGWSQSDIDHNIAGCLDEHHRKVV